MFLQIYIRGCDSCFLAFLPISLSHTHCHQTSENHDVHRPKMICFRLSAFLSIFFVISIHRSLVRATASPLGTSSLLGSVGSGGTNGLTDKLSTSKVTDLLGPAGAVGKAANKVPLSMPKIPGVENVGGLSRMFGGIGSNATKQTSNGGSLAGLAKMRKRSVSGAQRESRRCTFVVGIELIDGSLQASPAVCARSRDLRCIRPAV